MTRIELEEYLINEAEYDTAQVSEMTDRGLLDAWLVENGIVGFTDDILDVMECLDFSEYYELYGNR